MAEDEALAKEILRLDSITDREAKYSKTKEAELQRKLDEHLLVHKEHMEAFEKQKKELESARWQVQFEKEFAVKQYQTMMEENEREQHRLKKEELKSTAEEDERMDQMAQFVNCLDDLYEIREETDEQEEEMIIEDIIDDMALDALDLHDSDESGGDLHDTHLELDDLEDDAIGPEEQIV